MLADQDVISTTGPLRMVQPVGDVVTQGTTVLVTEGSVAMVKGTVVIKRMQMSAVLLQGWASRVLRACDEGSVAMVKSTVVIKRKQVSAVLLPGWASRVLRVCDEGFWKRMELQMMYRGKRWTQ